MRSFVAVLSVCDPLSEYVGNPDTFRCDEAPSLPCGCAYNSHMPTINLKQLPDPTHTVVIFESDRGWNAFGGMELLPKQPRHNDGDYYGLADGGARWVRRSEAPALIWDPAASPQRPVAGP